MELHKLKTEVIKLTGRYHLHDKFFIDMINQNSNFDVYAKWLTNSWVFTGCVALKWSHFKVFINSLDLDRMESNLISLEEELAQYILARKLSCCRIEKIHLKARVFFGGSGTNIEEF